jgi:hypothetical protein
LALKPKEKRGKTGAPAVERDRHTPNLSFGIKTICKRTYLISKEKRGVNFLRSHTPNLSFEIKLLLIICPILYIKYTVCQVLVIIKE